MTNSPKIAVVVDSTELSQTPDFQSGSWNSLITLCNQQQIHLAVPEIVLAEVGRQWAEKTDKFFTEIREDWSKRTWPLQSPQKLQLPDQSDINRHQYLSKAKSFLEEKHVQILPVPDIPISSLIERDLDQRKPFKPQGKGFRDAVIWQSVVDFAAKFDESVRVIFVSGNHTDFAEEEKLSESLRIDLPDNTNLVWMLNLRKVLEDPDMKALRQTISKPSLVSGHSLSHSQDDAVPLDQLIFDAIESKLEALMHFKVFSIGGCPEVIIEGLNLPGEIETLTISYWHADHSTLESHAYESYEEDRELHIATVSAELILTGALHIADSYILEPTGGLNIMGPINDTYQEVEVSLNVIVEANIDLNPKLRFIESCEIDSIRVN